MGKAFALTLAPPEGATELADHPASRHDSGCAGSRDRHASGCGRRRPLADQPHNDIHGIGDMNRPLRDWRGPVARVTVQCVQQE